MTGFGRHVLPYGSFTTGDDDRPRVGVAVDDLVLDLSAAAAALLPQRSALFGDGTIDPFLAAGPAVWAEVRDAVQGWLADDAAHRFLVEGARPRLAFSVADYVDFYASEQHATNVGRLFRPGADPLPANWKHLPIGYHGRAGTVVASGTPIVRPSGQRRTDDGEVVFGPSTRLDLEAEVGFVVGVPSALGTPVPQERFADHVFGVCLLNDWSARDLQAWEYVPLGPFLGKSFATTVSPWVVPLAALEPARVPPPPRDGPLLPYLDDRDRESWGLALQLEVRLNGAVVSRPPFGTTYWTGAQQLAHLTVNGASLRTGDLYASGTVSGPEPDQWGSLLELSRGGTQPMLLPGGTSRTFLEDGDEVAISATAPGPDGTALFLGEVRGTVQPAVRPG